VKGASSGLVGDLTKRWRDEANQLRRRGQIHQAHLIESLAAELDEVLVATRSEVLTLRGAAERSGYSEAHLARLVKQGKLPTLRPVGSRGRLTFEAADLPRKPAGRQLTDAGVHDLASRLSKPRGKEAQNGRL
jgi:hypothetical protein